MRPDLKSMNRKQLEKLRADIDSALEQVCQKELKTAKAAAEKAAKAYGFTLAELTSQGLPAEARSKKTAKRIKKAGAPKYANPDDKTQTWTGKGRRPDWYLAAIKAGKSPDDLAI